MTFTYRAAYTVALGLTASSRPLLPFLSLKCGSTSEVDAHPATDTETLVAGPAMYTWNETHSFRAERSPSVCGKLDGASLSRNFANDEKSPNWGDTTCRGHGFARERVSTGQSGVLSDVFPDLGGRQPQRSSNKAEKDQQQPHHVGSTTMKSLKLHGGKR